LAGSSNMMWANTASRCRILAGWRIYCAGAERHHLLCRLWPSHRDAHNAVWEVWGCSSGRTFSTPCRLHQPDVTQCVLSANWPVLWDATTHLILRRCAPAIPLALIARNVFRMLEVLRQTIRTRAQGCEISSSMKHAFRGVATAGYCDRVVTRGLLGGGAYQPYSTSPGWAHL
jgi:hypothetical protein